jgi:hypothetical protein
MQIPNYSLLNSQSPHSSPSWQVTQLPLCSDTMVVSEPGPWHLFPHSVTFLTRPFQVLPQSRGRTAMCSVTDGDQRLKLSCIRYDRRDVMWVTAHVSYLMVMINCRKLWMDASRQISLVYRKYSLLLATFEVFLPVSMEVQVFRNLIPRWLVIIYLHFV